MKKSTVVAMKNAPRFVDDTHVLVTKAFAKNARIFGTTEYKMWRAIKADCPNAEVREHPVQAARWVRVRWANMEDQPFETTLELDCLTRDGLLLDLAQTMTTARARVRELYGKDLPGGHSVFTVRFEVKNVTELETIRTKLLNIRDVIGSRRGQN